MRTLITGKSIRMAQAKQKKSTIRKGKSQFKEMGFWLSFALMVMLLHSIYGRLNYRTHEVST
jgi:hypothetical protein